MKRTDGDKADARAPSYTRRWMRLCVCVCVRGDLRMNLTLCIDAGIFERGEVYVTGCSI